jgi:cbb3-type cytochrome oxidase maturation protein
MDVIYGLIPMVLFFGLLVVIMFIWMAKKGYFDDMDGQANRILWDDDDPADLYNSSNKDTEKKSDSSEEVNKDQEGNENRS